MRILFTASSLLLVAFCVHLALWRVRLPTRQLPTLLAVFFAVAIGWGLTPPARLWPLVELLHLAILYVAVTLAYVITYTAIEGDSPTLSLMYFVTATGEAGLPAAEMDAFIVARPFIQTRLETLISAGRIVEKDQRYFVAGEGSAFFRLILAYRKLYGVVPRGG